MKIADDKTRVMSTAWRNLTFVRVLTDEGLEGFGEVRMLNHTDALLGYFAQAVPRLLVETGHFEGKQWIVDERRSSDDSDFGLIMTTPDQVVHVLLD
jgi:L-alanine-DL-glutamate epimerase-like enolase superfamily enzyme